MSTFDDLITKLSEKNLSDAKVDEILNAGETLAKALGDKEDVLEGLRSLRVAAQNKKDNKDIKQIDNPKDLNAMMDDYMQKIEKDPSVINHSREAEMAYKMSELVSVGKMNTEECLAFSEKLMKTNCAKYGSESDKYLFRDSITASYEYCGYQSEQQRKMGANLNKLDADISGKDYTPEKEKDLYERKPRGNFNHNDAADKFKDGAQSYEAGSGVFDRYKKIFKEVWSSPEVVANRKKIKSEWGNIKDAVKATGKIELASLKKGMDKNPKLAVATSLGAVFVGMGTANPALAAAGGVMLTASIMSLYNKKVKNKRNEVTAENTTNNKKFNLVNVSVQQNQGR